MSSGIGNIVKGFLQNENCIYSNTIIVSNFFRFENNIPKIDLDDLMATTNKEYIRIPEKTRNVLQNKKACLLFGDLIEDLKMINKEKLENTLTFGFLDENIENNLERFNKNFDIVLTEKGDFNNVRQILEM